MDKPRIKELIKAIDKARGNISAVARLYERPRSTVQSWIDASETAKQALEDARETRVDMAETTVYKAAVEENLSAAFYILNNDPAAKRRGWGPRFEHTGADGGDVTIRVIHDR